MAPEFSFAPMPSYKVSKAALNMLTTQYALELGKEGFTICMVSPGVSFEFSSLFKIDRRD